MFLDVYSDGGEILSWMFFLCASVMFLCITVALFTKYKKTPENNKDKKKRLKVLSIVSGIITSICCGLFLYVALYTLPKAIEADKKAHENNPWSPANNGIQSPVEESDQ